MAEKKPDLLELVVKNLEKQLEAAGITVEDLQKINEIAEQVKEKREKIRELQEEIERLKAEIEEITAPIRHVVDTINSADNLRLTLIGLGLISEETLRQFVNGFYKKTSRNGKGKKVIYKGKEYTSANALVRELAEQGEIKIPQSSYSAVRLLRRWARNKGLNIIEREDTLIIE